MESLLSDYTEDIESFENQGLGIPAVYLFLLQLRFLILTDNIRQLGVIAKSNSWDSRDAISNLGLVSCGSISMELFPHLLNETIELDQRFLGMYTCNFTCNFKKFMESLRYNNDLQICGH